MKKVIAYSLTLVGLSLMLNIVPVLAAPYQELARQGDAMIYEADMATLKNNDVYLIPVSSTLDIRLSFPKGVKAIYDTKDPHMEIPPELLQLGSSTSEVTFFCTAGKPTEVTNTRYMDKDGLIMIVTPALVEAVRDVSAPEALIDALKKQRCKAQ